jgi:hypothetical protein
VQLDLATVLVQWGAGGLACAWVTTRHREVGPGYGWLLRSVFGAMLAAGALAGLGDPGGGAAVRSAAAAVATAAAAFALVWSVRRRGDERFDPRFDLLAPAAGAVAIAGAADAVGGPYALALLRLATGSLFLGAVTNAMLLGHWYLVQPGLRRDPIRELVRLVAVAWPIEVTAYLLPRGMVSVLSGTIDDGYGGLIAWMWVVAAMSTITLAAVTWLALKEREYSAVMAATGLLYLAILTGFGTDLLPRAVLS